MAFFVSYMIKKTYHFLIIVLDVHGAVTYVCDSSKRVSISFKCLGVVNCKGSFLDKRHGSKKSITRMIVLVLAWDQVGVC